MITKTRKTKETEIEIKLNVNGSGKANIHTGVGFFDHMLDSLTRHSLIDLDLVCKGDLHIDAHHTVEDVGILLGSALHDAIFPVGNIERYANRTALLDEAMISVAMDISGRSYIHWEVPSDGTIGGFDMELVEEFFRALVTNMKITAHITMIRGSNKHHIAEATFKAFAVALRSAIATNPRIKETPSTKGVLG